jgi:hypothetical protein
MWSDGDRPFRGVEKIAAAEEFIFAAERLIARDVDPEVLPEKERATVEYYLELLSKKFSGSQARANISRVLQSALSLEDGDSETGLSCLG